MTATITSDALIDELRVREALRRKRIELAGSLMRAASKFNQPHFSRQAAAILTFG